MLNLPSVVFLPLCPCTVRGLYLRPPAAQRKNGVDNPVCPKTGVPMRRGARSTTLEYKGARVTFEMPGWYCDTSDESVHTREDLKVSERALNDLKAMRAGYPG
jgi:YgiT-type zinc finger domain-containing protein